MFSLPNNFSLPNTPSNNNSRSATNHITTNTLQPTEFDILCGRDKEFVNHRGNIVFQELIEQRLKRRYYMQAATTYSKKLQIDEREIVTYMQTQYGSRFLKPLNMEQTLWVEIPSSVGTRGWKLSAALRSVVQRHVTQAVRDAHLVLVQRLAMQAVRDVHLGSSHSVSSTMSRITLTTPSTTSIPTRSLASSSSSSSSYLASTSSTAATVPPHQNNHTTTVGVVARNSATSSMSCRYPPSNFACQTKTVIDLTMSDDDNDCSTSTGLCDKEQKEEGSPITVSTITTEEEVELSSSPKRKTGSVTVKPPRKRHRSTSSSLDAASSRPLFTAKATSRDKSAAVPSVTETTNNHKKDDDEDDTAWDEAYFQLAFFKATQGTTNVKKDYVVACDDNISSADGPPFQLGSWTAEQRTTLSAYLEASEVGADSKKERLLPKWVQLRIKRLRDIGFEFHHGWDAYYSQLVSWNESNGHVDIPPDFVCKDSNLQLGKWVAQQRAELSAYLMLSRKASVSLPSHIQLQIKKLIGIGLKKSSNVYHAYLEQLVSFKAATGHLKVPPDYMYKDSLLYLGQFVARQRAELSGYLLAGKINLPIPKLMMKRLEKFIDIDFEFYDDWDTFCIQLMVFKTSHDHTNVPSDYICPDNRLPLGAWVSEQRVVLSAYYQAQKEGRQLCKPIQLLISELLDIGFEFYEGNSAYYVQLTEFRKSHGHTSVPFDYVCPGSLLPLGKWVAQQRASAYFDEEKANLPFQFLLSHSKTQISRAAVRRASHDINSHLDRSIDSSINDSRIAYGT